VKEKNKIEYRSDVRYSYLIEKEDNVWNIYQVWYKWPEEGETQTEIVEKRDKFPVEFTTKKAAADYYRINLKTGVRP